MKIVKLLQALKRLHLLSPLGLARLARAISKHGINMMMLLNFAEKNYGKRIALIDDREELSYQKLLADCEKLSHHLHVGFNLKKGQKVAFFCKNHASLVKAVFAVSGVGADIYMLNSEMSTGQFNQLVAKHDFDLLIYDMEYSTKIDTSVYKASKLLTHHDNLPAINNIDISSSTVHSQVQRTSFSKIMLLTGGTTGESKTVAHQPSLFNYLAPFIALADRLKLLQHATAYIATPIYHGYGIAILFSLMALGKKVVLTRNFNAAAAGTLIDEHQVEVITVVPLMLQRLLDEDPKKLMSLKCIASGGAPLNPRLAAKTLKELGDVLFNLYGTSETGLNTIATPADLRSSLHTIGKKIKGMDLEVLNPADSPVGIDEIGRFCIKNDWSMKNKESMWIETGDVGFMDAHGRYFLSGRVDDMIISGGINVYPLDIERELLEHPAITHAAVIGMEDEEFGQRLQAFIETSPDNYLSKEALLAWLDTRVARYQLPNEIVFVDEMPYTPLGKLDKKQLRKLKVTS